MKTKPKSILSLLCLLALTSSFVTGCSAKAGALRHRSDMQLRNGVLYTPNSKSPYSGYVRIPYVELRFQTEFEGFMKDGKKDGQWITWHMNGQKRSKENYKDGVLNGKVTNWRYNGMKESESHYKNGRMNGKHTTWHENGRIEHVCYYVDGEANGRSTIWHENGDVKYDGIFKDDECVGMYIDGELVEEISLPE